jgi:hypothetical protein
LPARLIGGYDLCSPSQFPLFCTGPVVAHIDVDLTGELTLFFLGPFPPDSFFPFEHIFLDERRFVSSPIPESPSFTLTLIASVGVALAVIQRRRKPLA